MDMVQNNLASVVLPTKTEIKRRQFTLTGQLIRYTHLVLYREPPLPPEQPDFFGAYILQVGNIPQGGWFWRDGITQLLQIGRQYTTATILYLWHQSGCVHVLMLLAANPDSAISMTQKEPRFLGKGHVFPLLNCLVLVIVCQLEPLLLVFSW